MDGTCDAITYMPVDQSDKVTLLSSKEDHMPSQLVTETSVVYFSFPNDTILELLYDDGTAVQLVDSIPYTKEEVQEYTSQHEGDVFKSALAVTGKLLKKNTHREAFGTSKVVSYGDVFESVCKAKYTEDDELLNSVKKSESGNYEFAETIDDWYEDEIEEKVCNIITLWTGQATFKVGGSSYTLCGTIWCPSNVFNDYGTYGILCDTVEANLTLGNAEYEGVGLQEGDAVSYSVDFYGLKPNKTYYYRSYYKFNSSDHGGIVPKYGNVDDEVIYDPTVKSFTTGGTVLTADVETFTVGDVLFNMIKVEGGTFNMGATSEQSAYSYADEYPVHAVTLSTFYLAKFEVTQELWMAVMGENPSKNQSSLKRPVENVSWDDCQVFIQKLNEVTGWEFRLPTEAEWEYAARGGNLSNGYVYSGSNTASEVAVYSGGTLDVGSLLPNELGIYDMSGNVFEWCSDFYGNYSAEDQIDPQGPSEGVLRVFRGGGIWCPVIRMRISDRDYPYPQNHYSYFKDGNVGLRLALSAAATR